MVGKTVLTRCLFSSSTCCSGGCSVQSVTVPHRCEPTKASAIPFMDTTAIHSLVALSKTCLVWDFKGKGGLKCLKASKSKWWHVANCSGRVVCFWQLELLWVVVVALAQGHQIQLQGVEHVENCPLFADVLTSTTLTFIYRGRRGLMEAYGHEIGTYSEKHISTTFSNGRNSVLPVSPTCPGSKWLTIAS